MYRKLYDIKSELRLTWRAPYFSGLWYIVWFVMVHLEWLTPIRLLLRRVGTLCCLRCVKSMMLYHHDSVNPPMTSKQRQATVRWLSKRLALILLYRGWCPLHQNAVMSLNRLPERVGFCVIFHLAAGLWKSIRSVIHTDTFAVNDDLLNIVGND